MAEITYTSVVWTAGDILTEAKLDNMVANDRAIDAMYQGIELAERASPSTPDPNKVHLYAKDKAGVPTIYAINDAGTDYEISEGRPTFIFTVTGALVTGTDVTPTIPSHRVLTIIRAYAVVKTAPTGASLIIDINKNGGTIWATQGDRLAITATNTTGNEISFDTTALAADDLLTMDIDQVGSTIGGADLTVTLRCK